MRPRWAGQQGEQGDGDAHGGIISAPLRGLVPTMPRTITSAGRALRRLRVWLPFPVGALSPRQHVLPLPAGECVSAFHAAADVKVMVAGTDLRLAGEARSPALSCRVERPPLPRYLLRDQHSRIHHHGCGLAGVENPRQGESHSVCLAGRPGHPLPLGSAPTIPQS